MSVNTTISEEESAGICSSDARFCDSWNDGDLSGWTKYLDEGNFEATVVNGSDAPTGGAVRLQLSETTGGGTNGVLGWEQGQTGWDTVWTINGMFYTANIGDDSRYTTQRLLLYYSGDDKDSPIMLRLGITGGDGNDVPFKLQGSGVDAGDDASHLPDGGWSEDTWYHYEIDHDGDGGLSGRIWEDGADRPDGPLIQATTELSLDESRVAAFRINGPSSYRLDGEFTIQHGYLKWIQGRRGDNGDGEEEDEHQYPEESDSQFKATALTFLPGEVEDSTATTDHSIDSTIPDWVDKWFHADKIEVLPENLNDLEPKSLPEYDRTFPRYRVRNEIIIDIASSDGRTLDHDVVPEFNQEVSPVTLEGTPVTHAPVAANDEKDIEENVLRDEDCFAPWFRDELEDEWRSVEPKSKVKPSHRTIEIDGIEGVQAAQIVGGSDVYLEAMMNQARKRTPWYLNPESYLQGKFRQCGVGYKTSLALASLAFKLPNFYTFLDVIVMADGSQLVRVVDASVYPRHALYVNDTKKRASNFDKGEEWKPNQKLNSSGDPFVPELTSGNDRFDNMGIEAQAVGATPFPHTGYIYQYFYDHPSRSGDHPVMEYAEGEELGKEALKNQDILFPRDS